MDVDTYAPMASCRLLGKEYHRSVIFLSCQLCTSFVLEGVALYRVMSSDDSVSCILWSANSFI